MILNDLQRAEYVILEGQELDIERGVTVQLERGREVVVCRMKNGSTVLQFRKFNTQTSALHLEPDVASALEMCLIHLADLGEKGYVISLSNGEPLFARRIHNGAPSPEIRAHMRNVCRQRLQGATCDCGSCRVSPEASVA